MEVGNLFKTKKVLDFFDACNYIEKKTGIKGWGGKFSDELMGNWCVGNDSYVTFYLIDGIEHSGPDMKLFCDTLGITEEDAETGEILLYFSW